MMSSGSTTFFFDFDIFSMAPMVIGSPVFTWNASRSPPVVSKRISPGGTQAPAPSLYVSWTTMPWVKSPSKGSDTLDQPVAFIARMKKRA